MTTCATNSITVTADALTDSGTSPPSKAELFRRHVSWDAHERYTAARMRAWPPEAQALGLRIVALLKGPVAAEAVATWL